LGSPLAHFSHKAPSSRSMPTISVPLFIRNIERHANFPTARFIRNVGETCLKNVPADLFIRNARRSGWELFSWFSEHGNNTLTPIVGSLLLEKKLHRSF
jgi:hypothetical protein